MLVLNPVKPFYLDKNNKILRMGNFKETGKEINYEEESFLSLINNLKEPIDENDLVQIVIEETNLDESEIKGAIKYLKKENIVIQSEKFDKLLMTDYSRQDLFFSLFNSNFKSNKKDFTNKKILVLGLGGVGANVALMLSRAGFDNFILVDNDIVEKSNLIRQYPYTEKDIGRSKCETLANILTGEIDTKNIMISRKQDIIDEIKKSDFVLCTLDKPFRVIRRLINDLCIKENKPVIFAGFAEHVAMVGPFVVPHKSACLKCIDENMTEIPLKNVKVVPSYGPLCALISSIVTNEIIKYFNKYVEYNLVGKTLMFNFATYEIQVLNWEKKKTCEVCKDDSK